MTKKLLRHAVQPKEVEDEAKDPISRRYSKGLRTYLITLKFPDLAEAQDYLEEISYGGDCWEFRVDLLNLSSVAEETNIPSIDFVRSQLRILQELPRKLPILFTVRTLSQGGKFPDDAGREALELMKLAAQLGCEYIDVEITWPSFVSDGILAEKGKAKIVASFHEFTGKLKWTSLELQEKRVAAEAVGDIVKLCLQSTDIYDALELALYVRNYQKQTTKPIIAVAMGPNGQLSRYTAPITFVTHTRIPAPSGSDQLTIATINRALYLLGQLPKRTFCLVGSDSFHQLLSAPLTAAFEELGMPYSPYPMYESSQKFADMMSRPDLGGVSLTASHTLDVGKYVDSSSPSAEQIGFIDTTLATNEPGKRTIRGYNTFWVAIRGCIENSRIDLSGTRTALVLGAGQKAVAACYALQNLGFHSIDVANPAEESEQKLMAKFPGISFRLFNDIHEANEAIDPCGSTIIIDCGKHNVAERVSTGSLFACSSGILIELGDTTDFASTEQATCLLGNWKRYSVPDVWMEQARVQFKLWTSRESPLYKR